MMQPYLQICKQIFWCNTCKCLVTGIQQDLQVVAFLTCYPANQVTMAVIKKKNMMVRVTICTLINHFEHVSILTLAAGQINGIIAMPAGYYATSSANMQTNA